MSIVESYWPSKRQSVLSSNAIDARESTKREANATEAHRLAEAEKQKAAKAVFAKRRSS